MKKESENRFFRQILPWLLACLLLACCLGGCSGIYNAAAAGTTAAAAVGAEEPAAAEPPATEPAVQEAAPDPPENTSGFVLLSDAVPDAILEIRYYSDYNFIGNRIEGYEEPLAILTMEAAAALKEVSDELMEQGYRLKVYDAYRPQRAVTYIMNWVLDTSDVRMKEYFYPELEKTRLHQLGYIARRSGHSRGSTVDLTLVDKDTQAEIDMGGTFDYFGLRSHTYYTGITKRQFDNRMILHDAMVRHGFVPLREEWWHFTLENEPYPDTYFDFPVSSGFAAAAGEYGQSG